MNSTIELIFTVAGAALTLLAVYGAVRSDRKLFLSGIFYFSFLPLIGESMGYNADKAPIHILVIFMFLIQLALSLPNNITYGQDNAAANKLSAKIAIALLLINVGGIVYIFCLHPGVPHRFGYFHGILSLAILYLIIKRMGNNGALWSK